MYSKVQCSTMSSSAASSIGMSRKPAMRRIWPGRSRLQLGEVQEHHVRQVADRPPGAHVFPERPERVAVAREPFAEVLRDRVDADGSIGGPTRPGVSLRRLVPGRVGARVVVVHAPHHVAAVAADVEVVRALARTPSASTGRWVLRKRRCVCASTAGSFTAFGGTRRSSQGDISATGSPSLALEEELRDDLLRSRWCRHLA